MNGSYNLAERYMKQAKLGKVPNQAKERGKEYIVLLEEKVLDDEYPISDRFICLRMRFLVGGSCRHDDLRHTRLDSFELIFNVDKTLRTVITHAWQTKTTAR